MSCNVGVDWQLECGQIRQRGAHVLATGEWADCSFLLGPDKVLVKAHKLILAMASPVFKAMFYGTIAEGDSPIPIPDIQHDTFMKVLQYVYTDDIDLDDYVIGFELYYAAQKYMLPHLQTVCTAYLSGNLVPQNACRIYEFAELIGDKELEIESLKILKADTKLALSDNSIEDLALDTVVKIFSMSDINVNSELVLLDTAERYYLAMQRQKDFKGKSSNILWMNTIIDNYRNDDVATHSMNTENLKNKEECTNTDEQFFDFEDHDTEEEIYSQYYENVDHDDDELMYSKNIKESFSKNGNENIQAEESRETDEHKCSDTQCLNKKEACNRNLQNIAENSVLYCDGKANIAKYDDNRQNEENKETDNQDLVHKLINPIRFLTLTVKELAEYKPKSSLLTALDILALMMNIASSETYMPLPEGFSTCKEHRCYENNWQT